MNISVANSIADYFDVNIFWASVSAEKKKEICLIVGETQIKLVEYMCQKLEKRESKHGFEMFT